MLTLIYNITIHTQSSHTRRIITLCGVEKFPDSPELLIILTSDKECGAADSLSQLRHSLAAVDSRVLGLDILDEKHTAISFKTDCVLGGWLDLYAIYMPAHNGQWMGLQLTLQPVII